ASFTVQRIGVDALTFEPSAQRLSASRPRSPKAACESAPWAWVRAQRLSAARPRSQAPALFCPWANTVLNASRHHGLVHVKSAGRTTLRNCAQRLSASRPRSLRRKRRKAL